MKELLYNKGQREKKMTQILWEELKLEEKIIEILRVESHEPGHHFGRPFFTPYQIAIEFKIRYPEDFEKIGKPVGGKGTGQPDSVAQYFANELSRHIKNGSIKNIEGRFLHRGHLKTLQYYDDARNEVESSLMQNFDLSLYRLLD